MTRAGGYEFVNPLLSCDISEENPYSGYSELETRLRTAVSALVAAGDARRVSVYVRKMDVGHWTGINANDSFIPASLMKVPILIAYYKESERDTSMMRRNIWLLAGTDGNTEESIRVSSPTLPLGQSYTVQQLLRAMITQSDNNAAAVLRNAIPPGTLSDVYSQFGVPGTIDDNTDDIDPQTYMRFFRILYNASYLSRGDSQKALELLAQTEFKDGLVAGVPHGTTVSHKFGERTVEGIDPKTKKQVSQKRELSDCGIVYYPKMPYGICVMTEGADFGRMEHAIAEISKAMYAAADGGLMR